MRNPAAARSAADKPPSFRGAKIASSLPCRWRTISGRCRRSWASGALAVRPASSSTMSGAGGVLMSGSASCRVGGKLGDILIEDVLVPFQFRGVPGQQPRPVAIVILGKQRADHPRCGALGAHADCRNVASQGTVTHERWKGEAMHALDPSRGPGRALEELQVRAQEGIVRLVVAITLAGLKAIAP